MRVVEREKRPNAIEAVDGFVVLRGYIEKA